MNAAGEIAQLERLMDERSAAPGSTVWVIWQPGAPDRAPVTIAATGQDASDWAKQQPDPDTYRYTVWTVIGSQGSVVERTAAAPGSTVWVVWDGSDGSDLSPKTIASMHEDATQWASKQTDPSKYCYTEWRVIGKGWPGVVVGST